jgi:hypothetical protein
VKRRGVAPDCATSIARRQRVPSSADFHEGVRYLCAKRERAQTGSAYNGISRQSLMALPGVVPKRRRAEVAEATMLRRRTIVEGVCKLPHPLSGPVDPHFPTKGSLPFAAMKRVHVKGLRDTRADALEPRTTLQKPAQRSLGQSMLRSSRSIQLTGYAPMVRRGRTSELQRPRRPQGRRDSGCGEGCDA